MAYISVMGAAEKWGLSPRRVQEYCRAGRIPQARRLGRSWMIPDEAAKPADPRRADAPPPAEASPAKKAALPCTFKLGVAPFAPGALKDVTDPDPEVGALIAAEYALFTGNPAEAMGRAAPLTQAGRADVRLGAGYVLAMSALYTQNPGIFLKIARGMEGGGDASAPPEAKALRAMMKVLMGTLLRLQGDGGAEFSLDGYSQENKLLYLYCQTHAAFTAGKYEKAQAIAETALALMGEPATILKIYIHLAAAAACAWQGEWRTADGHFAEAWRIAQPDGIIAPFAELRGHMRGLTERHIKNGDPKAYRRILNLTYPFRAAWIKVHNEETGDRITDLLTAAQFNVAMMAAHGSTNAQIADILGISPGNARNTLRAVFDKLGISSRKELANHIY